MLNSCMICSFDVVLQYRMLKLFFIIYKFTILIYSWFVLNNIANLYKLFIKKSAILFKTNQEYIKIVKIYTNRTKLIKS